MCGIAGIYGLEDKRLLKKMVQTMVHRGPDDEGYYLDDGIMLGQRRLSIIDLNTGKQPIYNEDESVVVVFNGEIYNYKELKQALEKKGHRFYTATDTEVIVHSYEEYGENCISHFNGMFAFALYDKNSKKLILARDRTGIKPLYYTVAGSNLVFGSEIKSILEYEEIKREVDKEAFHQFMNIRYNPGKKTIFKNILKLLPGHYILSGKKGMQIKKYWDLNINIKDKGSEYYQKQLDKCLKESIARHLRSDVPLGILLSSGVDSSIITAYASRVSDKLKTFTMGFGEQSDECADAARIAEHFGTEHRNLTVQGDFLKNFPKLIWHMDQPKRNLYPYYIYEKLKNHVKVVLSGLGGDELLGGYTFRYRYMYKADRFRKTLPGNNLITRTLKAPARQLIKQYVKMKTNKVNIIKDIYLDKLLLLQNTYSDAGTYGLITTADSGFEREQFRKNIYGEAMQNVSLHFSKPFESYFNIKNLSLINRTYLAEFKEKLPNDFLVVDDAVSMANSVESRVPFLDNEMIDLCFGMPNKYKFDGTTGKIILRRQLQKVMPKKLIFSGKRGFASSTYSIYRNELRDIARDRLVKGNAVKQGFINKTFIKKIINTKTNMDKTRYYNFIWNLYAFEIWYDLYLKKIFPTK